jgi:carboxymethylenebutenolidase
MTSTSLPTSILWGILIATQTLPSTAPAPGAAIPPGEAGAKQAIETSPRHGEYLSVPVPGSDAPLVSYIVYPERKDKAPVVVVIHEIFGLTDWIRSVADRLAADGFIAIAPDLLSGKGPGGKGTDAFASRDDVVKAIRELPRDESKARLDAARAYATRLPAAAGRAATMGFCWGGAMSFSQAVSNPDLAAAVVWYGTSPDAEALAGLRVPVLGLYGADDARVNATIEPAREAVRKAGGSYEVEIYEGAGHGFLRAQADRDGANLRASQAAWPRAIEFLRKHTAGK